MAVACFLSLQTSPFEKFLFRPFELSGLGALGFRGMGWETPFQGCKRGPGSPMLPWASSVGCILRGGRGLG